MPWSRTTMSTQSPSVPGGDLDLRAGVGVLDGVLDQVGHAETSWRRSPMAFSRPRRLVRRRLVMPRCSARCRTRSTASAATSPTLTSSRCGDLAELDPRQLEQVLDDAGHAVGLVTIFSARRSTTSGSSSPMRASASSASAPDGRLQLVADVGDEVRAHGFEAAASVTSSIVASAANAPVVAVDGHGGDDDGALGRPEQLQRLAAVLAGEGAAQVGTDGLVHEHVGVAHAEEVPGRLVAEHDGAALVGYDHARSAARRGRGRRRSTDSRAAVASALLARQRLLQVIERRGAAPARELRPARARPAATDRRSQRTVRRCARPAPPSTAPRRNGDDDEGEDHSDRRDGVGRCVGRATRAELGRAFVVWQPAGHHVADALADVHGVVADALVEAGDQRQLHRRPAAGSGSSAWLSKICSMNSACSRSSTSSMSSRAAASGASAST